MNKNNFEEKFSEILKDYFGWDEYKEQENIDTVIEQTLELHKQQLFEILEELKMEGGYIDDIMLEAGLEPTQNELDFDSGYTEAIKTLNNTINQIKKREGL